MDKSHYKYFIFILILHTVVFVVDSCSVNFAEFLKKNFSQACLIKSLVSVFSMVFLISCYFKNPLIFVYQFSSKIQLYSR